MFNTHYRIVSHVKYLRIVPYLQRSVCI